MHTTCQQEPEDNERRQLLVRWFRWSVIILAALLVYPLQRFLSFRVKPKPRYVRVPAPLPLSGYHTECDFLLFVTSKGPVAVSRKCTHLGCRVNYLEDKRIIECPCHQSRFDASGKRLSGPARRDLPTYPVEIKTDEAGKISGYVVTL